MSTFGQWLTVTIAQNGTDSAEVNLGMDYEHIQIIIPAITEGTINLQVAESAEGSFVTLGISDMIASGSGDYADTFTLGGYQFIKIIAGAQQNNERTFRVRGYRT